MCTKKEKTCSRKEMLLGLKQYINLSFWQQKGGNFIVALFQKEWIENSKERAISLNKKLFQTSYNIFTSSFAYYSLMENMMIVSLECICFEGKVMLNLTEVFTFPLHWKLAVILLDAIINIARCGMCWAGAPRLWLISADSCLCRR